MIHRIVEHHEEAFMITESSKMQGSPAQANPNITGLRMLALMIRDFDER